MRKIDIEFTTYSPLFIGSNETVSSFGYLKDAKNGTLQFIDFNALVESINDLRVVDELTSELRNPDNFSLESFCKRNGIHYESFVREETEVYNKNEFFGSQQRKVIIQRFIRNANGYYIPGSSIKGAFETALEYWYYSKNFNEFLKIVNDGEIIKKKKGKNLSSFLNNELSKGLIKDFVGKFGKDKKIERENKVESAHAFSFLGFTDSASFGSNSVNIFSIKRKRIDSTQLGKGIPIYKEGVKEGVKFKVTMTYDESVFRENSFFEAIKKFGWDIIENDIEVPLLKPFYKKFKEELKGDGSLLPLNLGFGGSLRTKTLYLLLKSAYMNKQLSSDSIEAFKGVYKVKDPFRTEYPKTRDVVERLDDILAVPGWVIFKV